MSIGKVRWAVFPLSAALFRILIAVVLAHASLKVFPVGPWGQGTKSWADALVHWDSGWYQGIAYNGYVGRQSASFFPAYPLLAAGFIRVGVPAPYDLIIPSWLAFVGSSVMFYVLVKRNYSSRVASATVVLYCWSPLSIFLVAGYTESLFMLTVLLAFYLYETCDSPLLTFLVAGFASLQRGPGALLSAVFVLSWVFTRGGKLWLRRVVPGIGWGFLGEWGLLSYMAYLYSRYHNPLQFLTSEHFWGRIAVIPFETVFTTLKGLIEMPNVYSGNFYVTTMFFDDLIALAAIIAVVFLVRRPKRGDWTLYTLLAMVISVSTAPGIGSAESIGRYLMVLFPLYPAVIEGVGLRRFHAFLLPISVSLAVLGGILFNLGYWFT